MKSCIFVFALVIASISAVPVSHKPLTKVSGSPNPLANCFICKEAVSIAENHLKSNKTESQIEADLEKYCAELGNTSLSFLKPECDMLVQKTPMLIDYLEKEFDPETICKDIGSCKKSVNEVEKETLASQPMVSSNTECEVCIELVGIIEQRLASNQTEAQIQAALESFCDKLGNSSLRALKPECQLFAANIDELIDYLENHYDAETICKDIGLCSKTVKQSSEKNTEVLPGLSDDDNCLLCKTLVTAVDNELQNNATVQEIKDLVNEVCAEIGNSSLAPLKPECEALAQNVDTIIQMVVSRLDPDTVCKALGLCGSSSQKSFDSTPAHDALITSCDLCQEVVGVIESELEQNKTETEIQTAVKDLCGELAKTPLKSVVAECNAVADQIPQILPLIIQQASPKSVCSLIKLCTAETPIERVLAAPVITKEDVGVDECEICEELVTVAETELQSNSTETEIKHLLDEACDKINATPLKVLYPECLYVADNVPQIVQTLVNKETPTVACKQLKLCN